MTKEDATEIWLPIIKMEVQSMPECSEAIDMAIKALKQEPCTDAISREDALMALTGEWTDSTDELIHRFIKRIRTLPPVKPAERVGQWIDAEVLDKIRDDIVHLHDWAFSREEILRIIDKYKASPTGAEGSEE